MMSTLVTLEGFTGTPRFLDVDDAVHLYRGGRTMRRIAQLCDHVICGNRWLAQVYADYGRPVTVLPTAVDAGAVPATPLPDGRFRIGWIGTEGNLRYLRDWGDALRRLAQDRPEIEIAVCSDGRPDLSWLGPRVVHVPWSPAVETGFLSSLSGGLMPLPDRDWERGKCALKMLQYMAAARPVVVSPIGMNADLLGEAEIGFAARTGAEAAEALSLLASDPDRAARLGRSGRDLVERRYDVSRIAPRLAAILRVGTGESR